MKTILPWINNSSPVRIAVIGDIILDEYLDGTVSRISPEAPVPVHLVKQTSHSAGGSANAARNISLVGAKASLFGVCGKDDAADILFKLLETDGVDTQSVICVHDRPTNRKTRISASHQQMIRVDWERIHALEAEYQERLLNGLRSSDFDAILISDYGKGLLPRELLANIFSVARERKIPCVVDPKGVDFSRYQGCTVMTPNLRECYVALGLDEDCGLSAEHLGQRLQEQFELNDVLVTMGPQGMFFVPKDKAKAPIYKKAQAKEVFDVSGAGDTVAAVLAVGLASQIPTETVLTLATLAAGIVVGKWGTQAITAEELHKAALIDGAGHNATHSALSTSKIVLRENVSDLAAKLHASTAQVVFTNGCFDILHAGHVDYLEKAKMLGDLLVVGVNTDDSISQIKGPKRPIVTLEHRMRLLSALACVDYVIPFPETTPLNLIESLSPDILVKGADYKEDDIVGAQHVRSKGGSVKTIELVPGLSTSLILARLSSTDI